MVTGSVRSALGLREVAEIWEEVVAMTQRGVFALRQCGAAGME